MDCGSEPQSGSCFEPKTLDSLAGKRGTFGAVGAPDRGRGILISHAHCSAGDYLSVDGYPRSQDLAREALEQCRNHMIENLDHAVVDAAKLLDEDGNIRSRQTSLAFGCTYRGSQHGRAKCNILAHLGRILHASQDFYSHSNWVDEPNSEMETGAKNPPGLGQNGPAAWLDLRISDPQFPIGLISGCFDNISYLDEDRGCLYGEDGAHRIRHANVNKDLGEIELGPDGHIGPGTTERGAINDNFRRAVEAAVQDSADKWLTLKERIVETYGPERGGMMICAITHDRPKQACSNNASATPG